MLLYSHVLPVIAQVRYKKYADTGLCIEDPDQRNDRLHRTSIQKERVLFLLQFSNDSLSHADNRPLFRIYPFRYFNVLLFLSMSILEADSIRYNINGRQLLSDIYLKLETGKVTALVGRNGEGKTTLFKIIYGVLHTEDRSVRVDGKYPGPQLYKVPGVLGFLPQKTFTPKHLKVKNLFSIYNLNMSDCFADFPELAKCVNASFGSLSGGETRLFEIYFIVKSPFQFVILDEPFTLISPIFIERLKAFLTKEKANKGILLSDHLIHDVMDVCDDLYLLNMGVLKKTTIQEIKISYLRISE